MGAKRTKAEDKRKPKHSRDANRPAKGAKEQRDASTVRQYRGLSFPTMLKYLSDTLVLSDYNVSRLLSLRVILLFLCRYAASRCTARQPSVTRRGRYCIR